MTEYYVASHGDNANSGLSLVDAFRTVAFGIDALGPGDRLSVGGGVYLEQLAIEHKTRITIRSVPGEHAIIDGSRGDFQVPGNSLWGPGEVSGEFVTNDRYPAGTDRGAFLRIAPYIRLITYSRLEDLQAANERFGPLRDDEGPPGPQIVTDDGQRAKRPWVYMGPGLHQSPDGRIHLRLSHTHNGVPGLAEYAGPDDPAEIPLAIWTAPHPTVRVRDSHTVGIENLSIRHGGGRTIVVESSSDVRLDHVNVLAGPYGIEVGSDCLHTLVTDCSFDGGLPPWYFRSDKKDGYRIVGGGEDGLGEQTVKSLVLCRTSSQRTRFENCEFLNAHDLVLNGADTAFRRNWLHNINDDGIFVGATASNLRISENVFGRCLTGISMASKSTAGSMRFGNLFKSSFGDPDLTVYRQRGRRRSSVGLPAGADRRRGDGRQLLLGYRPNSSDQAAGPGQRGLLLRHRRDLLDQ